MRITSSRTWAAPRPRPRVAYWLQEYPRQLAGFRDSDGQPPRHTFFYPFEVYDPEHLDALADLCRQGFGEVEVDGRWCGVTNELEVLRETGCYADFTLPSAPSPAQTRKINSLYYAVGRPGRSKAHDTGRDVGSGSAPSDALLLIQGPLLLNWHRPKWGFIPRVENGCLQASQPPTVQRLQAWLDAAIQVPARPDWYFVKLHTHGAPEINSRMLLGEPMIEFHRALAAESKKDARFHYHYVTAREMFNLVKAAEANWSGAVVAARDFRLLWNGGSSSGASQGVLAE